MHFSAPIAALLLATTIHAADDTAASAEWDTLAATVHDAFGAEDVGKLSSTLDAAAAIDLEKALLLASQNSLDPTIVAGSWRPAPDATESAFHIALKAPISSYQQHLILGIVHSWVKRDPAASRAVIDSLSESPERATLQENYRQALLRFRPKDALNLALAELGTPGAIKISDAAHALATTDRPSAIASLTKIPTTETKSRIAIIESIARHWAKSEPATAGEWANTLSVDLEKEVAFETILYSWSITDPLASSAWALALSSGGPRDSALRALVFRTAHIAPKKAFHAALQISDAALQETALFTVITEWIEKDAVAARSEIENAPNLSDDLKERLKSDLP